MSSAGGDAGASDAPAEDAFTEKVLDLLVYAPIGLMLDAQTLAPDLARRGRQHTAAARQIGELAVKRGLKRLEEAKAQDETATPASPSSSATPSSPIVASSSAPSATAFETDESENRDGGGTADPVAHVDPEDLAIPDYDLLAASQVVKRLEALSAEELDAVRSYEASTRDRRTILHKIARLQE